MINYDSRGHTSKLQYFQVHTKKTPDFVGQQSSSRCAQAGWAAQAAKSRSQLYHDAVTGKKRQVHTISKRESKYVPVQVRSISRGATQVIQSECVTFRMSIASGNVIVAAIQIRAIGLDRYKQIDKQSNEITARR